jgi:hypothetical protein
LACGACVWCVLRVPPPPSSAVLCNRMHYHPLFCPPVSVMVYRAWPLHPPRLTAQLKAINETGEPLPVSEADAVAAAAPSGAFRLFAMWGAWVVVVVALGTGVLAVVALGTGMLAVVVVAGTGMLVLVTMVVMAVTAWLVGGSDLRRGGRHVGRWLWCPQMGW